jgi:arabinogalactan oligomer/maltooligosaccharide transport system permease protein
MLVAPGIGGLILLNVYPIGYEIGLAFSNMNLLRFRNPTFSFDIAWRNILSVFTEPVLKQQHFVAVFLRTALWTGIQVTFHVSLGLFLAMLLNRPMKLRGFYRTLLVVPWALPQVVAALAWRGEYNYEYGFLNVMLTRIGLQAVQWKSDPFWNFVAMNITNIWLGIPFMIVILLGGLQSLSPSYFEAADMDGASGVRKLRTITLPLIQPIMTPAIVLGIIWTFNNFNVPYFINENNLETSDILVTALFRAAFDFNRYGFSAMFALVIFLILLAITIVYMRLVSFSPSTVASRKARETLTVGENA